MTGIDAPFFFLGAAVIVAALAINLRVGFATGVIRYGHFFGRALAVDRRRKPVAFRAIVVIHVVMLAVCAFTVAYFIIERLAA